MWNIAGAAGFKSGTQADILHITSLCDGVTDLVFLFIHRGPGKRACQVGETDAGPTEGVRVTPGYGIARVGGGVDDHGHTPAKSCGKMRFLNELFWVTLGPQSS